MSFETFASMGIEELQWIFKLPLAKGNGGIYRLLFHLLSFFVVILFLMTRERGREEREESGKDGGREGGWREGRKEGGRERESITWHRTGVKVKEYFVEVRGIGLRLVGKWLWRLSYLTSLVILNLVAKYQLYICAESIPVLWFYYFLFFYYKHTGFIVQILPLPMPCEDRFFLHLWVRMMPVELTAIVSFWKVTILLRSNDNKKGILCWPFPSCCTDYVLTRPASPVCYPANITKEPLWMVKHTWKKVKCLAQGCVASCCGAIVHATDDQSDECLYICEDES